MSYQSHHEQAGAPSVGCAVVTVSDTRTPETDGGGRLIRELAADAGHTVVFYRIVRDERAAIQAAVREAAALPDCRAVLLTGGTGIAPRDCTPEALAATGGVEVEGLAEMFRSESRHYTPLAWLSRASAVRLGSMLVIALPGSPRAARQGIGILAPMLAHAIAMIDGAGHA